MVRVYLAAPLFNAAEKAWNEWVTEALEQAGYSVFLPQRDGILASELSDLTPEEKVRMVFAKDCGEVRSCDVLVFLLDGRTPDEGACVELGIAYAIGKRCLGVRTDVRTLEEGLPLNPMLSGCMERVICHSDPDVLLSELLAALGGEQD